MQVRAGPQHALFGNNAFLTKNPWRDKILSVFKKSLRVLAELGDGR